MTQHRSAPLVRRFWPLVLAVLAGGCGFHLAGSEALPVVLARPYLSFKDPYTDFAREFEHRLKTAGAMPAVTRDGATATIEVSKDSVEQRTLTVSALNIPTEYLLVYTVTYAVQGPDKELLPAQTISLSQDYTFSEKAVLAKEHEADVLRGEMARNLVSITMRRLASLK